MKEFLFTFAIILIAFQGEAGGMRRGMGLGSNPRQFRPNAPMNGGQEDLYLNAEDAMDMAYGLRDKIFALAAQFPQGSVRNKQLMGWGRQVEGVARTFENNLESFRR